MSFLSKLSHFEGCSHASFKPVCAVSSCADCPRIRSGEHRLPLSKLLFDGSYQRRSISAFSSTICLPAPNFRAMHTLRWPSAALAYVRRAVPAPFVTRQMRRSCARPRSHVDAANAPAINALSWHASKPSPRIAPWSSKPYRLAVAGSGRSAMRCMEIRPTTYNKRS